jgi:hypothetical protein
MAGDGLALINAGIQGPVMRLESLPIKLTCFKRSNIIGGLRIPK